MQYDAAVDPVIAKTKMKGVESKVAGKVITAPPVKFVSTFLERTILGCANVNCWLLFVGICSLIFFSRDFLRAELDDGIYVSNFHGKI